MIQSFVTSSVAKKLKQSEQAKKYWSLAIEELDAFIALVYAGQLTMMRCGM